MTTYHRTFVRLDSHEKAILTNMRKLVRKPNGKLPTQSSIIRGMIRDYWSRLHEDRKKPVDFSFEKSGIPE